MFTELLDGTFSVPPDMTLWIMSQAQMVRAYEYQDYLERITESGVPQVFPLSIKLFGVYVVPFYYKMGKLGVMDT